MNARDELAGVLAAEIPDDIYACSRVWEAWSYGTMRQDDFTPANEDWDMLAETADALLAAGYTRPRVVTTVEELDALPVGSVALDLDRDIARKFRGGWRMVVSEGFGDPWLSDGIEDIALPATVLYSPESGK